MLILQLAALSIDVLTFGRGRGVPNCPKDYLIDSSSPSLRNGRNDMERILKLGFCASRLKFDKFRYANDDRK